MLDIRIAAPQRHGTLTVFPLVSPEPIQLPYELLVEAVAGGALRITEVGTGTVSALLAINQGSLDVLILDGEQLIGAKQNRITNRSLVIPAGEKIEIPVSCMEQGRWSLDSEQLQPADQQAPCYVRRKAREVEARHATAGSAATRHTLADAQGAVWSSISEMSENVGARSHTGALNEAYQARGGELEAALACFPAEPLQVGLLAFLGACPIGMDLVGGTELYPRVHQRLVRGYVFDSLGFCGNGSPAADHAQRFLDDVRDARRVEAPSVGRGRYCILSGVVIGGELTDGARGVHLSAFPRQDSRTPRGASVREESPIAPPSRRRRRQ